MSLIAKKVYIDLPGLGRVFNLPGARFKPKGDTRTPVIADVGVVGYTEEHSVGELTMDIAHKPGLDLVALGKLKDFNVPVQTDGGDFYMMTGAWVAQAVEASDGKISIVINAKDTNKV